MCIRDRLKDGKGAKEIAENLGVHISTIYREKKRGQYEHRNSDWTTEIRYSPDTVSYTHLPLRFYPGNRVIWQSENLAKGRPTKAAPLPQ